MWNQCQLSMLPFIQANQGGIRLKKCIEKDSIKMTRTTDFREIRLSENELKLGSESGWWKFHYYYFILTLCMFWDGCPTRIFCLGKNIAFVCKLLAHSLFLASLPPVSCPFPTLCCPNEGCTRLYVWLTTNTQIHKYPLCPHHHCYHHFPHHHKQRLTTVVCVPLGDNHRGIIETHPQSAAHCWTLSIKSHLCHHHHHPCYHFKCKLFTIFT